MRHAVAVLVILLATAAPALADHAPRSRYFFGIGPVVRSAPSELGNLAGLSRAPYVARTIETPKALLDLDVGFRWRAGLQLGPAVFVALDTGFGIVELPEGPQMSAPFRQGSSATMLGVAGLRGDLSHAALGVELAGGFRHVTYCIGESYERHDGYSGFQAVAELRVRGELRLSASAMLGATLGTSLLDRGAWVGSLDVTFRPPRR